MIVVHHLDNSRSQRILWMLEELGLDYEIKFYKRDPATLQAPASLRAVHPLGKSPVITDDGKTIAESGAILEYLAETYDTGRLVPAPGTPEHLRYTYFMHYAEGSLMPVLLLKLLFSRIPGRVPWPMRPVARMISGGADKTLIAPQIANHFAFLESELANRDWFAGTATDVQMSFPIEAAAARAGLGAKQPRLQSFVDRIRARPAYRRALEKGGPLTPLK